MRVVLVVLRPVAPLLVALDKVVRAAPVVHRRAVRVVSVEVLLATRLVLSAVALRIRREVLVVRPMYKLKEENRMRMVEMHMRQEEPEDLVEQEDQVEQEDRFRTRTISTLRHLTPSFSISAMDSVGKMSTVTIITWEATEVNPVVCNTMTSTLEKKKKITKTNTPTVLEGTKDTAVEATTKVKQAMAAVVQLLQVAAALQHTHLLDTEATVDRMGRILRWKRRTQCTKTRQ